MELVFFNAQKTAPLTDFFRTRFSKSNLFGQACSHIQGICFYSSLAFQAFTPYSNTRHTFYNKK